MKNMLKEKLFCFAEEMLMKRDSRYRLKWVKMFKKETNVKLGYQIRNEFIEKNIEAILDTYSDAKREVRKTIKVVKINEKELKNIKARK
jgi:hypothetical protein